MSILQSSFPSRQFQVNTKPPWNKLPERPSQISETCSRTAGHALPCDWLRWKQGHLLLTTAGQCLKRAHSIQLATWGTVIRRHCTNFKRIEVAWPLL